MKYTNYPPGVRETDFIGDEEEIEEQEDSNFEDYYYNLKKDRQFYFGQHRKMEGGTP